MNKTEKIRSQLGADWSPTIYEKKVRSLRTRAVAMQIPARGNTAEILHTLLGIELKVGNRRIACPDLATARYLQVFARLGCARVAIPYDITKISPLADELETAWQRMLLLLGVESKHNTPTVASRLRSSLVREIRQSIQSVGAGEMMPEF